MVRQHKRLRLDQTDPSIPLQNEYPFLGASNDAIDSIFRTLLAHGEKNKMRMELVCGRFQFRIRQRSAWKGESKLELGQDEESILINGYKFSFEKAPIALAKLLDRIQVEEFVLNDMAVPLNVRLTLCHTITQHKDYINLKSIQLLSSFDCSPLLCALAGSGCGLEKVVIIECGDWENDIYVQNLAPSFFSMLSQCSNLIKFILIINKMSLILELLLPALANCHHIKELFLDDEQGNLTHQQAIGFAQFCSSTFPKLNLLCFGPTISTFVPLEFIDTFGVQLRSNITHFGFTLDSQIDSLRQFLATCCNWFPKLKTLDISCIGSFPTNTILESIGNIFSNYAGPGNKVYKFEFCVAVKNWGEVMSRLAWKKWNENDELVKIATSNGIWTCTKNNVEITLTLIGAPV